VSGVQVVSATTFVSSQTRQVVTANCPAGKTAIGGGAFINPGSVDLALEASYPAMSGGNPIGWTAIAHESIEIGTNWSVTAYAICATVTP
jgi:hypothetical protein